MMDERRIEAAVAAYHVIRDTAMLRPMAVTFGPREVLAAEAVAAWLALRRMLEGSVVLGVTEPEPVTLGDVGLVLCRVHGEGQDGPRIGAAITTQAMFTTAFGGKVLAFVSPFAAYGLLGVKIAAPAKGLSGNRPNAVIVDDAVTRDVPLSPAMRDLVSGTPGVSVGGTAYRAEGPDTHGLLSVAPTNGERVVSHDVKESSPAYRRTLVLDFDGVLHAYTSKWTRADEVLDGPVPGAMAFLVEAVRRFDVCVVSSRSHEPGGIDAMAIAIMRWVSSEFDFEIRKFGYRLEFAEDGCTPLRFPSEKPPAHLTIDDRAWTFDGSWPSLDAIDAFVPWNKGKDGPEAARVKALGRRFAAEDVSRIRAAVPASLLIDTGGDVVEAVTSTFREYRKVCAENAALRKDHALLVKVAEAVDGACIDEFVNEQGARELGEALLAWKRAPSPEGASDADK